VFGRGGAHLIDLVAGNRTSDYGGVHVRRPADDAVYALKGLLVDPLTRAPSDWRDKRVAAVPPESVAAIQIQRGGKRFELKRSDTAWTVSSGKQADSVAVSDLLGSFRDLRSTGVRHQASGRLTRFQQGGGASGVEVRRRAAGSCARLHGVGSVGSPIGKSIGVQDGFVAVGAFGADGEYTCEEAGAEEEVVAWSGRRSGRDAAGAALIPNLE